jgi:hypothetical protein
MKCAIADIIHLSFEFVPGALARPRHDMHQNGAWADNTMQRPCWNRVPLKPELKLITGRLSKMFCTANSKPMCRKSRGSVEREALT